ncbi:hypothetical protein QBC45DRAFT_402005 [Copromyces sp. CBS 386.78]|nr:hypothetical protein QBC45DRAFT_402005 [Copromyces sp. CBS 386.78]
MPNMQWSPTSSNQTRATYLGTDSSLFSCSIRHWPLRQSFCSKKSIDLHLAPGTFRCHGFHVCEWCAYFTYTCRSTLLRGISELPSNPLNSCCFVWNWVVGEIPPASRVSQTTRTLIAISTTDELTEREPPNEPRTREHRTLQPLKHTSLPESTTYNPNNLTKSRRTEPTTTLEQKDGNKVRQAQSTGLPRQGVNERERERKQPVCSV